VCDIVVVVLVALADDGDIRLHHRVALGQPNVRGLLELSQASARIIGVACG
jgi:hypothetical protein